MQNLKKREKEKLGKIIGVALTELMEEAEEKGPQEKEVKNALEKVIEDLLAIEKILSKGHNPNKIQNRLIGIVLSNGVMNMKSEQENLLKFSIDQKDFLSLEERMNAISYSEKLAEDIEMYENFYKKYRAN